MPSICPPCTPSDDSDDVKVRDLKAEAKSLDHCLFHKTYNPHCDGCVCGKSKDAPHYTGPRRREVTHFGSVLTGDIVHMVDADLGTGIGGYRWAFVTRILFGRGF